MPEKQQVLELLEKISEQNDEILSLLKKEKPTATTQDGPPDEPPGNDNPPHP